MKRASKFSLNSLPDVSCLLEHSGPKVCNHGDLLDQREMTLRKSINNDSRRTLPKGAGIAGLDEITAEGLPCGRTTLVCGESGCGRMVLNLKFALQRGSRIDEPGLSLTFEETPEEVGQNAVCQNGGVVGPLKSKTLVFDYVQTGRGEIKDAVETGLDGLLIRLNNVIECVGPG